MNVYLNRNFFEVLRNLKNDRSSCVVEYLEGILINDGLCVDVDYADPGDPAMADRHQVAGSLTGPELEFDAGPGADMDEAGIGE